MKIYNRIKLDIESWKVLEEDSFDYDGPLAYCDGTSSSSSSISSSSFSDYEHMGKIGRASCRERV